MENIKVNQRYTSKFYRVLLIKILVLIPILQSCESFLDVENPKTELVRETVFNSDFTATAALHSLYTKLSAEAGGLNSITFLGPLAADESILFSTDLNTQEIYTNNILPSNRIIAGLWGSSGYNYIYHVNSIIEGLNSSTRITSSIKTELHGEALFFRAFFHFNLFNLFGDIPYIKTTDYQDNVSVFRESQEQIYEQLVSDLIEAQSKLTEDYSYSNGERVIPNKFAALALLARVYLYKSDWPLAEVQATSVINNSNTYQLLPHDEVFLKNSAEAIWQIKSISSNKNTNEGNIFILTGTPIFSSLSDNFIDAFEADDIRRNKWVNNILVNDKTWFYPFKYKIRSGSTPRNEYSMVLRLAEQYLIRAEARCEQGNLVGAINDIDVIRKRSGLPLIEQTNPGITKEELRLAIERERRLELFSEWAHRWFDLKRTGRADDVLKVLKPDWQSYDALFPIPEQEILLNPNITPNPGY